MQKLKKLFDLFVILIISIPSFLSLLNNSYFSMHDDQHIARLFLLDKGISQGYLYPRWVDMLGFNFGYPLFNFYPPLVYYVSEFFHLIGFSFMWSIKVTFILGFILSAYGIFLLAKRYTSKSFAYLATVLYTYFFYHGTLIYVRGALSEFFSLALLPFVFLGLENLKSKPNLKNSLLLSIPIAFLILTHPLIAFPTLIYVAFFFLFYLLLQTFKRLKWVGYSIFSGIFGLLLSAFYWLPSMLERKFTLVDNILTTELAAYKVHFICLQQFLTSNWGYGGSIPGCSDGMTFQIGKSHIIALILSLVGFIFYLFTKTKQKKHIYYYSFFLFLAVFSLFMTTEYSMFIWKNIPNLSYLQFPWRFMTFANLFISLTSVYGLYLFFGSIKQHKWIKLVIFWFVIIYSSLTIFFVGRYFIPQKYITKTDKELTTLEEIAWRVSRSTFEFVPKEIKTTKSNINTTIPDIKREDIVKDAYLANNGVAEVKTIQNKFMNKEFQTKASKDFEFRLNTFNFPGWTAYINGEKGDIYDKNDFNLITIRVPKGESNIRFIFEDTLVRSIGNYLSLTSVGFVFLLFLLLKLKKIKS